MGSLLGPRLPQSNTVLLTVDPRSSVGITNTYTNLISTPETFSSWTQIGASVSENTIAAPDGTLTGDTVSDTVAGGSHYVGRWGFSSPVFGTIHAFSVFAKAGTINQIVLEGSSQRRGFDLSNGTTFISDQFNQPQSWNIEPVGNGWYRCSIIFSASTAFDVNIKMSVGGSDVFVGSLRGNVNLWGGMLTQTSTLQPYTPQSIISSANTLKVIKSSLSTTNTTSAVDNTVQGQIEYTQPGTYLWQCPPNVTSVSVVCVGGGGGGGYGDSNGGSGAGGNLRYKNNIPVVPGQQYRVIVGAGGDAGTISSPAGKSGSLSSFGDTLVVAHGGGGGSTVGGTVTGSGNEGIGSNGGKGNSWDGGGGGAGGYLPVVVSGVGSSNIRQVGVDQFDATGLGPVTSVDTIGLHPSASIMTTSGYLKYTIAKSIGSQTITVFYRKNGTTISQSAFVTPGGTVQYTASTSSILIYSNDDHDSMFIDADGAGVISRSNTNTINLNWDKFRGTQEVILNSPIDSVATYVQSNIVGNASTIISFPLTTSSVTINFTSSLYKVNNGSVLSLPSPLTGITGGGIAPANSIWSISDGVNQFLIGRYNNSTAYLVTVDLATNTVSAVTRAINLPSQINPTEEDAIGTQLFAVDGVATWNQNATYYYGGTSDWKTNTNVFNTSGKSTFSSGSLVTQTDMDIWGSIDANGNVWFADWGHDDGGLFNIGNDDRLNTRPTNIRYAPVILGSETTEGSGGGDGGHSASVQPGAGYGGAGGGGGAGSGGAGGGGVGIYGYTNDGAPGLTKPQSVDGIQQGGGGSGGTGGLIKLQGTNATVAAGGLYGGGGGAGFGGGAGGRGAVRIMWGQNRSFPYSASNVIESTGSLSSSSTLENVATLGTATYNSGYLEFSGNASSYAVISNVPTSDFITINAAIYLANWTTATGTFLSNADADGTTRYQLGINNPSYSGSVGAIFKTRAGNLAVTYSRSGITTGWHVLTATFNGTSALLYLDGVQVGSASISSTTLDLTGFNNVTLAGKLTGTTVSEAIACRIGTATLLNQAYSANDALSYFLSIRGRYGI